MTNQCIILIPWKYQFIQKHSNKLSYVYQFYINTNDVIQWLSKLPMWYLIFINTTKLIWRQNIGAKLNIYRLEYWNCWYSQFDMISHISLNCMYHTQHIMRFCFNFNDHIWPIYEHFSRLNSDGWHTSIGTVYTKCLIFSLALHITTYCITYSHTTETVVSIIQQLFYANKNKMLRTSKVFIIMQLTMYGTKFSNL